MRPQHSPCRLRRVDGATQVSWIPTEKAVVGKFVKLKERGVWENGWEVVHVYSHALSEYVFAHARAHKDHRKATDV